MLKTTGEVKYFRRVSSSLNLTDRVTVTTELAITEISAHANMIAIISKYPINIVGQ